MNPDMKINQQFLFPMFHQMNLDYNEIIVNFDSFSSRRMAEIILCHLHSVRACNEFDE